MKMILYRAIVVAITLGVLTAIFIGMFGKVYHESSFVLHTSTTLTGLQAAAAIIRQAGLLGFIISLVGPFIISFVVVFIGAIWQGIWINRQIKNGERVNRP